MKLFLERAGADDQIPDAVFIRVIALNDSYEPVPLDHRLLIGPNLSSAGPFPVSVEPSLPKESDNITILGPWCLYGRQRPFDKLHGAVTFHAYLVREADTTLTPTGPANSDLLVASAESLTLAVE